MTGRRAVDLSPITRSIVVRAPRQRAFDVFTTGCNEWWPREHHLGDAELEAAVMEPREGGRWYERTVDGRECDWGEVLAWEPPERVLLSWDINARWQADKTSRTEVEVRFIVEDPETTRVELEHRGFDRLGGEGGAMRGAVGSGEGWGLGLKAFAEVAEAD
jgi:uncharacterized protein YndB with AHSA1/START domain